MRILVTGGAGFIGSNFVQYELQHHTDDEIYDLDSLTYSGNLQDLCDIEDLPNYHFIHLDITDRKSSFDLFDKRRFDVVVDFASKSHVDRSVKVPGIFSKINLISIQVLLDASRVFGVKDFHQVSTDEVCGERPLDRPELFFTEEPPLHPSSPYSASKASADLLVQAYEWTYGQPISISSFSNNCGTDPFPEKLIPLVISRALAADRIPVYGRGKTIRDSLHVYDLCAAINLIIRHAPDGSIYNIGGHNERDNLTVVKTILRHLRKPEDLVHFFKDRSGQDMRYTIDPSK